MLHHASSESLDLRTLSEESASALFPHADILDAFKIPMDPLWVYFLIRWHQDDDKYPNKNVLGKFLITVPGIAGNINHRGPTLKRIGAQDWEGCIEVRKELDSDPLSNLNVHTWVCILTPGPYRNDVGWVVELDHPRSTDEHPLVTVLIVPRVRIRREHPSGVRLLVKMAFSPPSGVPIYKQQPITKLQADGLCDEVSSSRHRRSFQLTKHGLLLRPIAPEKLSPFTMDGSPVFPSRFQLRYFLPDLKDHGDIIHRRKAAPLDEEVEFTEGDKVGLLGRPCKTLEFMGILTGVRGGGVWTARDVGEGEGVDPMSYRLWDKTTLVKFFHPMEYVTSLRSGRSGLVVSIDQFGVATLLACAISQREERDELDAI
jgi:hypothetical protein